MMANKLLFITRHYLDDNNGGANATKGFIHAFCRIFDNMSLIYPEHDEGDSSGFVPSVCTQYPCYDRRSIIKKGLDVYRGRLHRFCDYVRNHLKEFCYDVIIIDHSLTAASLINDIKSTGAKVVTIHHNVEKNYIKDNEPSLLYRIPYDYFAIKAEKDALLLSDVNLTLTSNDAEIFKSWYPKRELHLHSIGICEYRPLPDKTFKEKSSKNTFIITGSLCFKQSNEPIIEFIYKYYPLLAKKCPDHRLIIAGRNPSEEIKEICSKQSNITLIGNPDDMDTLLEDANYYICPINAGSGIKLRVIDGLKNGLPIICHEVSAVGYESFAEKSMLFKYSDEMSFGKALDSLMTTIENSCEIYRMFKMEFRVDALADKILTVLKDEKI